MCFLRAPIFSINVTINHNNSVSAQENQTITLADSGRTITLNVNETFLLNLGEGYDWNITIDDQIIFSRVVNVVEGSEGIIPILNLVFFAFLI